jgi:hypothetical protein
MLVYLSDDRVERELVVFLYIRVVLNPLWMIAIHYEAWFFFMLRKYNKSDSQCMQQKVKVLIAWKYNLRQHNIVFLG